jgi:twitching motility two-component system response regulator PilH
MQVKKILVVDDSSTVRHYMVDTLMKLGFEVVTAENGDEAIAKSKTELPDLILMDVVMPEMNGFQATRAISREAATQHIPVMLLTSKDQATDRIWGLRQGAREYLIKPISGADLLARIHALERMETVST